MAKKGFTLIEIMIAVTIVALLSAVVAVTAANLQRSARDSRRVADLKIIQTALQNYYADQNFYPTSASIIFDTTARSLTSALGNPLAAGAAKVYLNRVPNDPISNNNYAYEALPAGCDNVADATPNPCRTYCLYANVEFRASEMLAACPDRVNFDLEVTQP